MLISESSTVNDSLLSIILISGGLVSLVVTVLGIKLRWFRHRLTFEEPVDNSTFNNQGSSFEIRESCARGLYRQTLDVELLESLSAPVVAQQTPQTNDRESIFRWPFRSKLQLTHKLFKEDKGKISTLQSAATSSHEHEHNIELREKNEKLKKMINERISLQTNSSSNKQYREVSVDRNEPVIDVQQIPLPLKRKSLEVTKEIPIIPPVVKPRTIVQFDSKDDEIVVDSLENFAEIPLEPIENLEQVQVIEETPIFEKMLPKSILKNSETNSNSKTIKFQDVSTIVTSSESDTDDSSDSYEENTWNLVDEHRNALNRKHRSSPSPPPLPKSSPPSMDMDHQRSNNYLKA